MSPNLHQIKSEQTRQRLLDAALALMKTKGHGQVSMHEVAQAAGMTSGAVQYHFATKASLMLAIMTRLIEQLEAHSDFWPPLHWPLAQRADHFVAQAWAQMYGQARFTVAWSAYLSAQNDPEAVAHIIQTRAGLGTQLQQRMAQCFPELGQGPEGEARVQFVLSALRGMGLVAPFSSEGSIAPQLRVLSQFLQSFASTES